VTVALRAWLRYAYLEGLIPTPLAQAVPLPARWRLATAPTAVGPEALAALVASCDLRTVVGRRDYAVLLVLSRLGLRAGEVARLALSDVGWRDGVLRVVGKGPRVDLLPLPAEVGQALEDYVRDGRPREADGALFRRIPAPRGALDPPGVTTVVYRACDRAGLPRVGAHQLRHAAATGMRAGGASLPQIAQVLRHQSLTTTAVYARTDLAAQAPVVRPWPGGAS
jgi:integrase